MKSKLCVLFILTLMLGVASGATIFSDGFEPGPLAAAFTTVNSTATLGPWTVSNGSIDWIGGYWTASAGTGSVDMAGNSAGTIKTQLPTIAGQTYVLSFDLAGNPDSAREKILDVLVGDFSGSFHFNQAGTSRSAMGWQNKTVTFVASGSDWLTFAADIDSGYWGPALR